ncbi:MAG: hypothetical protein WBQ79_04200 [Acidobacteriaceae bacterium]
MDPAVNTVANTLGLPDYTLDAVRSMRDVKYAVPLFSGGALVKLEDGQYQPVTVIGLDDSSPFGRPQMSGDELKTFTRRAHLSPCATQNSLSLAFYRKVRL